ncbi:MAG: DUF4404 family protein [SAR324 cluster bacterium]|nr:DUF4404 family protein [SAR324 cluster bacterium]
MDHHPLNEEALRQSIENLRSEIDKLTESDEQAMRRLSRLLTDLEHKLENPDDAEHHESLMDMLGQSIEQFEVQHPAATGVLNHIMTMLGNMGI